MRKITMILMSLGLTFGCMAQNIQFNKMIDGIAAFSSDFLSVRFDGKLPTIKSVAAQLSNVQTGYTEQYGNYIAYTITPNEECIKVGVLVQDAGVVSGAVAKGMAPSAVFDMAEAQYQAQGASVYIDVTPNEPITRATIQLDANVDYEIALLAIGTSGDSAYYNQTVSFNGETEGKEGFAKVEISVQEVENTSAKLAFTVNDQTAYFYYLAGYTDNLQSQGLTDLNTFEQAVPQLLAQNYLQKMTSSASGTIPNLESNASYSVIALAYNGKNEAGGGDVKEFTTTNVSLSAIDLTQINVYPNPTAEKLVVSSLSVIESAELFTMTGQKVYSSAVKSNGLVIDVMDLANGNYILRITTDKSTQAISVTKQ